MSADVLRKAAAQARSEAETIRATSPQLVELGLPIPYLVSVSGNKYSGADFAATEQEFTAWADYTEAEVEHGHHHGADWSSAEADVNGLPLRFSVRHEHEAVTA